MNRDTVRDYRRNGFVHVAENVLEEHLELCIFEFDRVLRDAASLGLAVDESVIGAVGIRKVARAVSVSAVLSGIATSHRLAELIYFCTDWDRVFFWSDALYFKPPQSGDRSTLAFHQDMHYWKEILASPEEAITAVVPLYSASAASGGVGFAEGSKEWPLLVPGTVPSGAWREFVPYVEPGHVTLHHPMIYHGSRPNRTAEPRRSISLHFTSRADLGAQEVTPC